MLRIRKVNNCYHTVTHAPQLGFLVARLRGRLLWVNLYRGRPGVEVYWLPLEPHL